MKVDFADKTIGGQSQVRPGKLAIRIFAKGWETTGCG